MPSPQPRPQRSGRANGAVRSGSNKNGRGSSGRGGGRGGGGGGRGRSMRRGRSSAAAQPPVPVSSGGGGGRGRGRGPVGGRGLRSPSHQQVVRSSVRRISVAEAQAAAADIGSSLNDHAYADDDTMTFGASTIRTDDVGDDVTRLYAICEMALPGPDDAPLADMSPRERAAREERLEATWEALREWLTAHPSLEERSMAATHAGQFSTTALHLLCKLPFPPADVVEGIVRCEDEVASWQDSNGWLPLHHAVANGASVAVLTLLCGANPGGKVMQDKRRRTPLHFAFFRSQAAGKNKGSQDQKANRNRGGGVRGGGSGSGNGTTGTGQQQEEDEEMVQIVSLLGDSGAAKLPDEGGMLAMHYACAYGTTVGVLEILEAQFPQSTAVRELKGRTPLHLAMVNAHRSASPNVVQFLLRNGPKEIVDLSDAAGYLPISLLAMIAKLGHDKPDARKNASECLEYYLNARPTPTADFLSAVQSLPEWLRDKAVSSSHVHNVLNERIVQRFPTSILLLDGYMHFLIIIVFSLNSKWHIDNRFEGTPIPSQIPLYLQFVGGGYFFAREMAQVISMSALGTFKKWLFDLGNVLDVTVIFLVVYYGVLMIDPTFGVSNDFFRNGVAATQGVLWVAVLIYVKSILVDFAVFVGGVFYVVRRLVAFMVSLGVILFAFAQSFYFVFSMTPGCERDENGDFVSNNPHCSFGRSLLRTYSMILGEIGDATQYYAESLVAQVLYVLYAFLVVLLLATVLIAIVTDSYGVIKNERAALVFWSNRLDFVAEMDAIANAINLIVTCGAARPVPARSLRSVGGGEGTNGNWRGGSRENKPGSTGKNKGPMGPFRRGWKAVTALFDPNLFKDSDTSILSTDFWCYIFLRLFAAFFVIPMWILAGVVTAGWLWPPQVREFLFAQTKVAVSRADIAEGTKNEVTKLKAELTGLRGELKQEIRKDRKQLLDAKTELDNVQDDVMSDVKQVKDIITTLFELSRDRAREKEERASAAAIAAARIG